jgi:signal transduction histidine kinase
MRRISLLRYITNAASYFKQAANSLLLVAALMPLYVAPASHAMVKKTDFMIIDAGLAHPCTVAVTNQVVAALHTDYGSRIEIYWENLDAMYHSDEWRKELGGSIVREYRGRKLDLIVLAGEHSQDIPIVVSPSIYIFDWHELHRWKLDESKLPTGSAILFLNPTLSSLHKWTLFTGLLIIVALSLLTTYLLIERKKLKQARKAQEKLSGMLISAQEDERSRIAGEIHDDFSQRMAVLALGLGTAAQTSQDSPEKTQSKLQELTEIASSISSDLHTLSHRLHSATLESLGLAPGVSALCKEFSAQQGIKIDRTLDQIPRSVDPDVALCIFRIVQESLRNVKKHSEASSALVSLQVIDNTMHLSVSDQGKGFNPIRIMSGEGLGIRSMEERVRLLGGRIEIRSKEGMGTKIEVWLPLHTTSAPGAV